MGQKKPVSTNLPIDAMGNTIVDPTKNVTELVEASERRQDDLRHASDKFNQNQIRWMEKTIVLRDRFNKELTTANEKLEIAESKRLDSIRMVDVAAAKTEADRSLAAIQLLATQTHTNAENLRNALNSTAATIAKQTSDTVASIVERIAALEKSSYEGKGKGSVIDPQMAALMEEIKTLNRGANQSQGRGGGMKDFAAWIIAIVSFAITVVVFLTK